MILDQAMTCYFYVPTSCHDPCAFVDDYNTLYPVYLVIMGHRAQVDKNDSLTRRRYAF